VKILWLKSDLLHPIDRGGKIRTYQMLRHLKELHEITYLALTTSDDSREAFDNAAEYCSKLVTVPWRETQKFTLKFYGDLAINLTSHLPYAVQKYQSEAMHRAIQDELSRARYDVIVCDFLVPSINLPKDLNIPVVLFQHNVESMIWHRHYETAKNGVKKAYFYGQWRKILRYERAECRRVNRPNARYNIARDFFS